MNYRDENKRFFPQLKCYCCCVWRNVSGLKSLLPSDSASNRGSLGHLGIRRWKMDEIKIWGFQNAFTHISSRNRTSQNSSRTRVEYILFLYKLVSISGQRKIFPRRFGPITVYSFDIRLCKSYRDRGIKWNWFHYSPRYTAGDNNTSWFNNTSRYDIS